MALDFLGQGGDCVCEISYGGKEAGRFNRLSVVARSSGETCSAHAAIGSGIVVEGSGGTRSGLSTGLASGAGMVATAVWHRRALASRRGGRHRLFALVVVMSELCWKLC